MLLYTTLFVCGAVVMSVEILGSRVLSVEFGEDLYSWGALIGTFIGALSLGYWAGGTAADKWPTRLGLAFLTLLSGILIAVVVSVMRQTAAAINALPMPEAAALWAGPLMASAVLYGLPIMLLGAVSPYCVRLAASDLSRLGRKVGGLYAISSLGSIFGTFLTAFYLVGEFGVDETIRVEGVLLMLFSIPLFASGFTRRKTAESR
jgi:predicted membrane-bound spermidine synthase